MKWFNLKNALWIGLIIRLLFLFFYPNPNFPDAQGYATQADHFLIHHRISANHIMPLYPILMAITGKGIFITLFDILCSTLCMYLIYALTLEIFNKEKIASIAAWIAAFYPHFIFYSVSQLTETIFITLYCAAFLALFQKRFWLGALFLVLAVLTRATVDIFNPLLILIFAFGVHRLPIKTGVLHLGKYLGLYCVLLSPWWLHNYAKFHSFVRLSLGDGIVLYSGNNPLNQSGGGVAYGKETDDMDLTHFSHIANPVARNDAMIKEAKIYIRENPKRFFELARIKFLRFWRLWPYAPEYTSISTIAVSLLSYGVVLFLALIFLIRNIMVEWRKLLPVYAFVIYLTAVHMVLIGSIRYRLPLEPFLIVLASYSICQFQRLKCLTKSQ